ncbi:hypothetical protein C8Q79DRAFT_268592 [Trametes meyenii]|nr:hypothetical protein C8Q79DRAFT_268592 [Trametes meyenii]
MSSVAAMSQSLPPGDEDLAQLYHQVLAGFAEESPTSEQSLHSIPSHADREAEPVYSQYQDGEATPTANRLQPSARSLTAPHSPHYGLPSSPRPPQPPSLPPAPPTPTQSSNPQSPSQRAPRPLPRIPGSAAPVPPPPSSTMYAAMPEPRPYHADDHPSLRPKHSSSESGRRLPPTPGDVGTGSISNGYHGTVNPPPNSAMLGRLPSLNGSRPGSSGTRPGSSDSSLRAQYAMPVPDTSDTYSWRAPAPPNDPRRPPAGALPPQVPGYNSVYEDERPPSSPSDGYSMRGDHAARPGLRPYSPSQHSTSSYGAAAPLPHSQSCAYDYCYM